jgi:hypothetical protein
MAALAVCILAAPVAAMDRPDLSDYYHAVHECDYTDNFVSCDVEEKALLESHGNVGHDSKNFRMRWMIYEPDDVVRKGEDALLGQGDYLGLSIQRLYPPTGKYLDLLMAPVPGCKAAVKMWRGRVLWRVRCSDTFEEVVTLMGLDPKWAEFLSDELGIRLDRKVVVKGRHTE